jgi:hypothetical protein
MRVGRRRTRAAIRSLDHRLLRTRGHAPPIEAAVVGLTSTGQSGHPSDVIAGAILGDAVAELTP